MSKREELLTGWTAMYPKNIRYRKRYAQEDFDRLLINKAPCHINLIQTEVIDMMKRIRKVCDG